MSQQMPLLFKPLKLGVKLEGRAGSRGMKFATHYEEHEVTDVFPTLETDVTEWEDIQEKHLRALLQDVLDQLRNLNRPDGGQETELYSALGSLQTQLDAGLFLDATCFLVGVHECLKAWCAAQKGSSPAVRAATETFAAGE
jgi:hypothetical protein